MAAAPPIAMRRSYDQLRANDDDEQELNSFQSRSSTLTCSFCEERFTSSGKLSEHLLLCGNKTDQCPNCYKLIRRSHFAYHYENNCAPIDRVETPPLPPRSRARSAQHPPANLNKPFSREDIPDENYSPRANGRIQSPSSTPRNSPGIIECDFCHQRYGQNDYRTHRDNCIQNPLNPNHKPQLRRIVLGSNQNQNHSNDVVRLPCEICNEPVDIPDWSRHMQKCRERENQRLERRAQSMSDEPVTEQLPCEHCQQLYSARQLHEHEDKCPKNPANARARGRTPDRQQLYSKSLPTRSNNNRSRTRSADRALDRHAQYQSIDVDRTRAANRPIEPRHANPNQIRHSPNENIGLRPDNPPLHIEAYDNEPMRGNQPRPPNGSLPRRRPSFDQLQQVEDNQDPKRRAAGNRSPYPNDARSSSYEVINNQENRPLVKKHKKPSFLKSLFCGVSKPRVENDEYPSKNNRLK